MERSTTRWIAAMLTVVFTLSAEIVISVNAQDAEPSSDVLCPCSEEMSSMQQMLMQQQQLLEKIARDVERLRNSSDGNCVLYPGSPSNGSETPGVLIQQYFGGGTPFFNRTWNEFKAGFGNPTGNYWIGLDKLHELTATGRHAVRFDLQQSSSQTWFWAEYSTFSVADESSKYMLHIGGYSGTAGDAINRQGGAGNLNGALFSTWDRDNDLSTVNCAKNLLGGFWFAAYCSTTAKTVCLTCSNLRSPYFTWYPTNIQSMPELKLMAARTTMF